MSIIDEANQKSFWRGIDYFERKQVIVCKKVGENECNGLVLGSEKDPYFVHIDLEHPKKSQCNCKFAEGRNVVCKHMVAMYFTVHPNEAKKYIEERDAEIKEYEERQRQVAIEREKRYQEIYKSLSHLTKEELQSELAQRILSDERYYEDDCDEYEDDIYEYYY